MPNKMRYRKRKVKPSITGMKLLINNKEYILSTVTFPDNFKVRKELEELDNMEITMSMNKADNNNLYTTIKNKDFYLTEKVKNNNITSIFLTKEYLGNITLLDNNNNEHKLDKLIYKMSMLGIVNSSTIFKNIHIFKGNFINNYDYMLSFAYRIDKY